MDDGERRGFGEGFESPKEMGFVGFIQKRRSEDGGRKGMKIGGGHGRKRKSK